MVWNWNVSQGSSTPDQAYCDKFYNRTMDLINKYHPDMIYYDDTILPLYGVSDVGLKLAANYYNASMQWHGGRNEAVVTGKGLDENQRKCMVWDIERGASNRLEPLPWETDTCIGNWHYDRRTFENHGYKTADQIIHTLVDVVSKNGNLMLSIPVKGDGTIDTDEVFFLGKMASWMKVNRECIFGTRPWAIYGEGPIASTPPQRLRRFQEPRITFTSQDIRFTSNGNTLYAIIMAWPTDGKVTVKSLATGSEYCKGQITDVRLLGSKGKLHYAQDASGLTVTLPEEKPCDYAYVLKVSTLG
jgi:alpha-L-fucosidase